MRIPKIYLAGPSVFRTNWKDLAQEMKDACALRGAISLYPMDAAVTPPGGAHPLFALGLAIFAANTDLIDQADAVVADLSPFRGPSADVGTVWEIAYAQGQGKPIAGFSTASELYAARVPHTKAFPTYDYNTNSIEQCDMADNLMIVGSLCRSNPREIPEMASNGGFCRSFEDALDLVLERLYILKDESNA
jgi:nucleoside 2-deoxyribosyltransferase